MNITILGGGSWGTALAVHLAQKHSVKIWEFVEEQARKMQEKRLCPLLPGVKLADNIFVSSLMEDVLPDSELVLLAVPSDHVESTMDKATILIENQPVIICSKGFASGNRLLSEVVKEKIKGEVYCLYGPTHAEEVCKGMFTGVILAGENPDVVREALEGDNLHVETTEDIIGVQVAAALKNIVAVFIGILDGLGMGDNAKAYVMTKGLEEIKEIGLKWGAKEETFYGLAGMGDIIVTGTSKHSRNRSLGEQIGKGHKLNEILDGMPMVAEGVTAAKYGFALQDKFGLQLPLITGLHAILFSGKDAKEMLSDLF